MGCEEWCEPISAYVDGECDAAEVARITGHLAACPACHDVVDRAEGLRRRLLLAEARSSDDLRTSILAAHDGERAMVRTQVRRRATLGLVASLVAIGGAVAAFQGLPSDSDRATDVGAAATPGRAPAHADHEVVVDQVGLDSGHELHIRAGESVAWRNDGAERHALVHQIDGSTVVGSLDPGQTETITFASPGSYEFRCAIHEAISGEVHVTS